MSRLNERIDEILRASDPPLLTHLRTGNPDLYPYIRKAMEQYGKEVHADGMREGHSHGIAWAEKYLPELDKLRELVQAQKELIKLMKKVDAMDFVPKELVFRLSDLNHLIKQLEQ